MATTFTATCDGTNGAAVTKANSGFDAVNSGSVCTYLTTSPAFGTASIKWAQAGTDCTVIRNHGATTLRFYDWCQKLSTLDSGDMPIAVAANGSDTCAQIYIHADATISIRNKVTAVAQTTTNTFPTTQWVRIQWKIDAVGGTQTARIWISATLADLFNNAPTQTLTGNYTQGTWDRIRLGSPFLKTISAVQVDRVIEDDSQFPTSGASGNQSPVAHAGTDQSVASAASVSLNGSTSSDADGTIAAYAWTQVSGPVVTLSGASTATPSFLAPTVSTNTDLSFGLRVTDDQGAQSTQDVVVVTVNATTGTPTDDFSELFEGAATGTTMTTSNTGFDSVDAGVTFSGTGIGEGSHSMAVTATAIAAGTHIIPAGAVSECWYDVVVQVPSLPTSGNFFYFGQSRSGSTARGDTRINSDGTISIRNGTTAVATTTHMVTAGQAFRVARHLNNGGTQELKLYLGANLWGNTPDETKSGVQNTGTFDRVRWGFTQAPSASSSIVLDSLRFNTDAAKGYPLPIGGSGGGGGPTEAFVELFEDGTNGAVATTGNTAFDGMSSLATFTSDAIGDGALAVTAVVAATTAHMTHIFTTATTYYTDWVYRVSALPPASPALIASYIIGSSTNEAKIILNTSGTLAIQNVSSTVDTSTFALTAGQVVRLAWGLTGATQTLNIYHGANLWGVAPDEVLTGAAANVAVDRIRLGQLTSGTVTWTIDSVRADPASWPLPIVGGHEAAGSNKFRAHGGAWLPVTIQRAHAGAWVG